MIKCITAQLITVCCFFKIQIIFKMTSFVVSESLEAVSYCDIGKKGRGVTEDMVEVDFNVTKYKMKENEDTRKIIESKWQKKTAGNDRIFNATKFRIASHKWDSASGKLQLKIGITNYKDHVGTTLSPEMSQFEGQGDSRVRKHNFSVFL